MKIAYYIDSVIPSKKANTVHVMKMCQALQKNGADVTLVCDGTHEDEDTNIWNKYAITERFNIKKIYLPRILRDYGHRLAADLSSWLKSKVEIDADFSYSRSSTTLFFLKNKRKFIFEAHQAPDKISKIIIASILKHKNCVSVVVISQALKNKYSELFPFFPKDRIVVLHDAADLESPDSGEKAELAGDKNQVKIGYLGHLYPGKCMEVLLPIAKKMNNYSFHVVGGTEEWINYWTNKTREQNVKNIIFYGFVDNSQVGSYYRAFDICVLPFSRNVYIGKNKKANIGQWISPLKLFEAMAYSKAIVTSNLDTIKEVLVDGVDCFMVDPDNIEKWEERIVQLANDSKLRNRFGKAAFEKLMRNYTWDKRAQRVIALLDGGEECAGNGAGINR